MRLILIFFIFTQTFFAETVKLEQVTASPKVVVSEADYNLKVTGPFTEVNATITVYNEDSYQDRVTFFYKLPEEATVNGFALDIKGRMRQASAVEKDKARIAFETEVRGKVDPALMEWNQGNIFQTQIYPVDGNASRKVRVSYIIPTENTFEVPLEFTKLKKFSFSVSSSKAFSLEAPVEMLRLSNSEGSFMELRAENTDVKGSFKISIEKSREKLYTEKNKDQNLYWIYKEALPFQQKQISLKNISSIAVFQDVSLSRDSAKLIKETEFLKELVKKLNKPLSLKLYRFNVSPEFHKTYTLDSDESFNKFALDYQNCILDGGTDFSKLIPSVKLCKSDFKIIFSDGLNNFENFSTDEKIVTVNSSDESDLFTLKAFGEKSIKLHELKLSEAIETFLKEDFQVKVNTPDTFVKIENGQVTATGILKKGQQAEFSIYQNSTELKFFVIQPAEVHSSDIVRKYWSQEKLYSLMKNSVKNKAEITELGKSHNLVTPYTSMIVMESMQQYLDHEIRPPDDEPELQALYDKKYKAKKDAMRTGDQLANIASEWEVYKKWWETYSTKEKEAPLQVKVDKNMTAVDQAIAQRRAEQQNEEIYTEEYFRSVEVDNPAPPAREPSLPPVPEPLSPDLKKEANVEEILKNSEIPEEKLKPVKEKLNKYELLVEELNKENDGLKNENGRLRAENRRVSAQIEELKELYFTDRSRGPRPPSKTNGDVIQFSEWDKDSSTVTVLKYSKNPYEEYLKLRERSRYSPGFYFECADFFLKKGETQKSFVILSNIIEISKRNSTLLRMAAYKMSDTAFLDEAIYVLREIMKLRPEEPHSYRDLALALVKKAEKTENPLEKDSIYTEALALYKKIIESTWYRTHEFSGLSQILVEEYNNLILKSKTTSQLPPALKDNLDMDLRIVVSWDTDMTDLDLHVIQPDKEKVYYGNKISKAGGRMSNDFTRGLGPETYCIRYALPGEYTVYGNVYGANALFFNGQISVKVDIYLNYGRPNQIHKSTTVKITEIRKDIELAKIKLQ